MKPDAITEIADLAADVAARVGLLEAAKMCDIEAEANRRVAQDMAAMRAVEAAAAYYCIANELAAMAKKIRGRAETSARRSANRERDG